MPLTLGEIFDHVRTLKPVPERAEWLREHVSAALLYILQLSQQTPEQVKWALPEGTPKFKAFTVHRAGRPIAVKPGMAPSELSRECRRLYLFFEGFSTISQERREKIFAQMLEGLDAQEVEILLALKDGTFATKYKMTPYALEMAFPGITTAPFSPKFIR